MSSEMDHENERIAMRDAIDGLDAKLVKLLGERKRLTETIGALKAGGQSAVRDLDREREVINRAIDLADQEGLDPSFIEKLFQHVIDESLRNQRAGLDAKAHTQVLTEARVSYLGGPGSYSHFAANTHFSGRYSGIEPVIKRDFASIFRAVEDDQADYGFLPIENTTTGGIVEVYDLMRDTSLKITGEHHYKVEHCVIGKASSLASVQVVYGHPQALRQSQRFLSRNPGLKPVPVSSSTRALERAMDEGPEIAAIAGPDAARLFGLNVIDATASDHPENYTRFVALAREAAPASKLLPCKTSLVFITSDDAGSLVDALDGFRENAVNLTKLESRPIAGKPFEQMFFLDLEGHEDEDHVKRSMETLREYASSVHSFGSYGADRLKPASR